MSKVPSSVSIVVVTYHNDFLLLERLLNSIYQYWEPSHVDSISVVLNDSPRYYSEFDDLISRNTNPLFKIKKVLAYELEPTLEFFDWHSQQLLKCLSYRLVETDWYVINDCKDFYIKPVSVGSMFDSQGRATMHLNHARYSSNSKVELLPNSYWSPGPFSIAHEVSCKVFDLDPMDHKVYRFPTTTPFIVKREIMKGLVEELKTTTKGFFQFLFSAHLDGQSLVTEFLLYGAYCYKTTEYRDYVDWDVNHREFFLTVSQSKDLRTADNPPGNVSNCNV